MPFAVHIPKEERDLNLDVRLRAELTGILTWAVQGCLAWQAQGLAEPAEVMQAHKSTRRSTMSSNASSMSAAQPRLQRPQ